MRIAEVRQVLYRQLQQAQELRAVLDREPSLAAKVPALQRLEAVFDGPDVSQPDL